MLKLLLMIKTLAQNDQEGKLTSRLLASINDAIEQFVPGFRSESDKKRVSIEELNALYSDHPGMKKRLKN